MTEYQPTLFFGFQPDKKDLHQMWVDQYGNTEWRKVPTITMTKPNRPEAIAGYAGSEDGEDDPETH